MKSCQKNIRVVIGKRLINGTHNVTYHFSNGHMNQMDIYEFIYLSNEKADIFRGYQIFS